MTLGRAVTLRALRVAAEVSTYRRPWSNSYITGTTCADPSGFSVSPDGVSAELENLGGGGG